MPTQGTSLVLLSCPPSLSSGLGGVGEVEQSEGVARAPGVGVARAGMVQQEGAIQRPTLATQGGGQLGSWLSQQGSMPPPPYGAAPPPPSLPTQPTAQPMHTTQ